MYISWWRDKPSVSISWKLLLLGINNSINFLSIKNHVYMSIFEDMTTGKKHYNGFDLCNFCKNSKVPCFSPTWFLRRNTRHFQIPVKIVHFQVVIENVPSANHWLSVMIFGTLPRHVPTIAPIELMMKSKGEAKNTAKFMTQEAVTSLIA